MVFLTPGWWITPQITPTPISYCDASPPPTRALWQGAPPGDDPGWDYPLRCYSRTTAPFMLPLLTELRQLELSWHQLPALSHVCRLPYSLRRVCIRDLHILAGENDRPWVEWIRNPGQREYYYNPGVRSEGVAL